MNTVLFKCAARKLIAAKHERLIDQELLLVISGRVKELIRKAEAYGFTLHNPYRGSKSLPNLLSHTQFKARYSQYEFDAGVSCWADGEVVLTVMHSEAYNLLWLRIFKTGYLADDFQFHRFLKGGA